MRITKTRSFVELAAFGRRWALQWYRTQRVRPSFTAGPVTFDDRRLGLAVAVPGRGIAAYVLPRDW